jgi:hypothetical protein
MNQEHLELPVSPSAQDLFALEEKLRDGDPDTSILSNLPNTIRDRILLQLEFMELEVGQIKTIFSTLHPNAEERRKAKEKNRRAWAYLLQEIAAYVHSFSEASYVVSAARVSVDHAIVSLDRDIKRLKKFKNHPGIYERIKDFAARKSKLEKFRDNTLDKHEKTLQSDPAPRESKLAQIKQEIEEFVKGDSLVARFFSKLMKFAPAVIEKFKLRNTTKSIFKDVAKEVAPLKKEAAVIAPEPEPEPEPTTPEPAPKKRRTRLFRGLFNNVGMTIRYMYEKASENKRSADTAFNRKARGPQKYSSRAGMVMIALPALQQGFQVHSYNFSEQDNTRLVATDVPAQYLPSPDNPGYFPPVQALAMAGETPQAADDDSGDDDGGDDGSHNGDRDNTPENRVA